MQLAHLLQRGVGLHLQGHPRAAHGAAAVLLILLRVRVDALGAHVPAVVWAKQYRRLWTGGALATGSSCMGLHAPPHTEHIKPCLPPDSACADPDMCMQASGRSHHVVVEAGGGHGDDLERLQHTGSCRACGWVGVGCRCAKVHAGYMRGSQVSF